MILAVSMNPTMLLADNKMMSEVYEISSDITIR